MLRLYGGHLGVVCGRGRGGISLHEKRQREFTECGWAKVMAAPGSGSFFRRSTPTACG